MDNNFKIPQDNKLRHDDNNNKEKILNTALELFSQKGYDAVGVQSICEASGITKPTLYYYFQNKAGLLQKLLKINYEKLNSLITQKSKYKPNIKSYHEDVYPVLKNTAESYFAFAKNNEMFYRIVLQALCAPKNSELFSMVEDFNKEQYNIIEKMFTEMSTVHQNMQRHEKRLAWTFIGMINSYIMLKTETTTDELVHQFMHGIFS